MNNCSYSKVFIHDNKTHCTAYSKVKRYDGKKWCAFPLCKTENCPLIHPELIYKEGTLKL